MPKTRDDILKKMLQTKPKPKIPGKRLPAKKNTRLGKKTEKASS